MQVYGVLQPMAEVAAGRRGYRVDQTVVYGVNFLGVARLRLQGIIEL